MTGNCRVSARTRDSLAVNTNELISRALLFRNGALFGLQKAKAKLCSRTSTIESTEPCQQERTMERLVLKAISCAKPNQNVLNIR